MGGTPYNGSGTHHMFSGESSRAICIPSYNRTRRPQLRRKALGAIRPTIPERGTHVHIMRPSLVEPGPSRGAHTVDKMTMASLRVHKIQIGLSSGSSPTG